MKKFTTLLFVLTVANLWAQNIQRAPGTVKVENQINSPITGNIIHIKGSINSLSNGCDTLDNFLATDSLRLYPSNNWGYISGMNNYGDLAKASKFSAAQYTSGYAFMGAYLFFGKYESASASSKIKITVWDTTGTGGSPGTVLGTTDLILDSLINVGGFGYVSFASPIAMSGDFFIGVEFNNPYIAGDTVALVTNSKFGSQPGTGWEQWSDASWHTYNSSWGYDIDNIIYPVLCTVAPGAPQICIVTADSLSLNNIIVWDKTLYTNVDSFIVYRADVLSQLYLRIGAVSNDSLSMFVDTARSIGGPNGGDPRYAACIYKLTIRDIFGNYSDFSCLSHKSIFVQQNGQNFSWNAYTVDNYGQSGGPFYPVIGYQFLRDDNNTGNWNVLVNVPGTATTDPNFANFPNGRWRVQALGFNCTATQQKIKSYNASKSNTSAQSAPGGIGSISGNPLQVSITPNLTTGKFSIEINDSRFTKCDLKIYNTLGETIYKSNLFTHHSVIDLTGQFAGIYIVELKSADSIYHQKLIIQ